MFYLSLVCPGGTGRECIAFFFFFFDMNLHRFQTDLALSETHIENYFMIVLYIFEAVCPDFSALQMSLRECVSVGQLPVYVSTA